MILNFKLKNISQYFINIVEITTFFGFLNIIRARFVQQTKCHKQGKTQATPWGQTNATKEHNTCHSQEFTDRILKNQIPSSIKSPFNYTEKTSLSLSLPPPFLLIVFAFPLLFLHCQCVLVLCYLVRA
jgi:hypothetical protein